MEHTIHTMQVTHDDMLRSEVKVMKPHAHNVQNWRLAEISKQRGNVALLTPRNNILKHQSQRSQRWPSACATQPHKSKKKKNCKILKSYAYYRIIVPYW